MSTSENRSTGRIPVDAGAAPGAAPDAAPGAAPGDTTGAAASSPIVASWNGKMEFKVEFPHGEAIHLTSVPAHQRPGVGPNPMEAVQAAMAACTGMDVVMILGKMRKRLHSLRVHVEGTRRSEEPRVFTELRLAYLVDGPDLDPQSVQRAVSLSHEKYCSVSAMLAPTVKLGYRIVLNGEEVV